MARPRKFTTPPSLSGITLDAWQRDTDRIRWAQLDPRFREILAVLMNERSQALFAPCPMSENRLLGRAEGYELAIQIIKALAQSESKPLEVLEPTYEPPEDAPTSVSYD